MKSCNLCPRNCNVDRQKNIGFCGVSDNLKIAKADLHFWEEPCISGIGGSGTVFFSGCSLGCVFCQNKSISHKRFGKAITDSRFYEILFELKERGAENINLVTADHYLDKLIPILKKAKLNGLDLPIILNTSSYLKPDLINRLKDVVDVFIADLKFFSSDIAKKYCNAYTYPDIAKTAIDTMYSLTGKPVYKNNIMVSGVIVRILVLPGNLIDAKRSVKYILDKYGENVCLSVMNQFTPVVATKYYELCRKLTESEYKSVVDFAVSHKFKHGYIQQNGSDVKEFIPDFDLKGV